MNSKFIIVGVLFILILISGFLVSKAGRPINSALVTLRKLISIATAVYLIVNIIRIHRETPLSSLEIVLVWPHSCSFLLWSPQADC